MLLGPSISTPRLGGLQGFIFNTDQIRNEFMPGPFFRYPLYHTLSSPHSEWLFVEMILIVQDFPHLGCDYVLAPIRLEKSADSVALVVNTSNFCFMGTAI